MPLTYDERWVLVHLAEGWILQKHVLRRGSYIKAIDKAVAAALQEKGLLAPVEVEGKQECCGISETGGAALASLGRDS